MGLVTHDNQNLQTVYKYEDNQQLYCRWTAEEDRKLKEAVAKFGIQKWTSVSKLVPGRTATQCSTRWLRALNPNVHKGKWSKQENKALYDAVYFYQKEQKSDSSQQLPWNLISERVPFRSSVQCQARWTETLDPNIRKGRWSAEEDRLLHEAKKRYGYCWVRVASMVPTRTQRQCRTRWKQIFSQKIKYIQKQQVKPSYDFESSFNGIFNQKVSKENHPISQAKNPIYNPHQMQNSINTCFPLEIDNILNQEQPLISPPPYSSSSTYSFDDSLVSSDMFVTSLFTFDKQADYLYKKPSFDNIKYDISKSIFPSRGN